jgi:hypothetical protein
MPLMRQKTKERIFAVISVAILAWIAWVIGYLYFYPDTLPVFPRGS